MLMPDIFAAIDSCRYYAAAFRRVRANYVTYVYSSAGDDSEPLRDTTTWHGP